jgi:hypothetical protein
MRSGGTSAERRKTRRFPIVIPIEVGWCGKDGISVSSIN